MRRRRPLGDDLEHERCTRPLFVEAHFARRFPGPEMMPRLAVRADDDPGLQSVPEFAFPHLEGAGGGEFVIIKVRVDKEDFHVDASASKHSRFSASSRLWRAPSR